MIELNIKRAEVLADGYDSYGRLGQDAPLTFIRSDLIRYLDNWTVWLCVFSSNDILYGFDYVRAPDQSPSDLNDDLIKCFEVEIDPTPRYRRKKNG